jgi:hypothetical protein
VLSKETREEDLSGNALACHGRGDQELGKHGEPIVGWSGHVHVDQEMGDHRRKERRREEGGVHGQPLGDGGGVGVSTLVREGSSRQVAAGSDEKESRNLKEKHRSSSPFFPNASIQVRVVL